MFALRRAIFSRGMAAAPRMLGSRLFSDLPSHEVVGLPALSPTMESGTIASWTISEGDSFGAGDVICEVETDKATVAFESQDDGVLAKILVQAGGSEIKVGDPICVVVEDDADVVDEEYGRRRGASLRSMAAFAAHALAERRGGWDHETAWARELEWGDGGDDDAGEDRVGAAIETPTVDGVRDVARGIAAVNVANETKEDEGEAEDEVAAAEWNMWESRSVLDYSVGFLRGALG